MLTDTILRLPQVKAATGLARSTIYLRIKQGSFPPPVPIGLKAVGWSSQAVNRWIQQQLETTRAT